MILTYDDIIKEVEKNKKDSNNGILIEPFNSDNVCPNSIDVTLSNTLVQYFHDKLDTQTINDSYEYKINEHGYIMKPGVLYLGCTNELTFTPNHVPIFHGKSSLGRLGLFVHITAGLGDVGFKGRWTLELACVQPVKIYPNMKIGQISFHTISSKPSVTYKDTGRYMNQDKPTPSKGVKNK